MKCLHPIDVSIKTGGDIVTIHKRNSVTRDYKRVQTRGSFLVPCGKCFACKSRRKSEMVARMDFERRFGHLLKDGDVKKFRYCFFVTLTYADRFLPHDVVLDYDSRTGEVLKADQ